LRGGRKDGGAAREGANGGGKEWSSHSRRGRGRVWTKWNPSFPSTKEDERSILENLRPGVCPKPKVEGGREVRTRSLAKDRTKQKPGEPAGDRGGRRPRMPPLVTMDFNEIEKAFADRSPWSFTFRTKKMQAKISKQRSLAVFQQRVQKR